MPCPRAHPPADRPRVSPEEVRHVAALAQLEIAEDEIETFRVQFERILAYVAQLAEVDTAGVEPTAHVLAACAPLRPDEIVPGLPAGAAAALAPEARGPRVCAPPVMGRVEP